MFSQYTPSFDLLQTDNDFSRIVIRSNIPSDHRRSVRKKSIPVILDLIHFFKQIFSIMLYEKTRETDPGCTSTSAIHIVNQNDYTIKHENYLSGQSHCDGLHFSYIEPYHNVGCIYHCKLMRIRRK